MIKWRKVAVIDPVEIDETAHRLASKPGEPRLTRFVVHELSTAHWFDISAARRDLGYSPGISIAEGLELLRIYMKKP